MTRALRPWRRGSPGQSYGWLPAAALLLCLPLLVACSSNEKESKQVNGCGVERWPVKTLADSDAARIELTPVASSVKDLRALPAPKDLPQAGRVAPTELTVFTIQARLVEFKREDDRDVHVVVASLDNPAETMIVEFVDPACTEVQNDQLRGEMTAARQQLQEMCGGIKTKFTACPITVEIRGVGFFDFIHGQTGVAPNGIELHPVLSIENAETAVELRGVELLLQPVLVPADRPQSRPRGEGHGVGQAVRLV